MLKAEVEGYGIQQKGVPQGGVISTILANVVLNELDWWIYGQWEGVKTSTDYNSQGYKIQVLKNKTELKVKAKKKKYVAKSNICDKAKNRIIKTIKEKIEEIKKHATIKNCNNYNATILGLQNYYRIASNYNLDFSEIAFLVRKSLYNSTRSIRSRTGVKTKTYERIYGKYNFKIFYIAKVPLFPIAGVVTRPSQKFLPEICSSLKISKVYKILL